MKYAKLLSLFLGVLTFVACGDDDESLGDLEVAELRKSVLLEDNKIAFEETETEGVYQIGLLSLDDARYLAKIYAGEGFTGKDYTRVLIDNKGTVKVSVGDNGIYYLVNFNVSGLPKFKLNLFDGSKGGNKLSINHHCDICGMDWVSTISRCPNYAKHPK